MAVNGDVLHNGGEHESPVHGSAKYISPHIGNISRGDNLDLISRKGGSSMDQQRKTHIAYEYLCHLEETKQWLEACIEEELPMTTGLEEALRTGVILCKLGHWYAPEVLPVKKIYDLDGSKFKMKGLHFKHTDNFNFWLVSMRHVGLPEIFYPETTDLYDKKNMPRVIYCIHALSLLLHKLGKAPEIEDLVGEATFTEEEISTMKTELDKYGINMPAFGKIGGILANELSVDEAAIHAAVLAINEIIENDDHMETLKKLQNPMAVLKEVEETNAERYHTALKRDKEEKGSHAAGNTIEDIDAYDILLTQSEIQDCIDTVNSRVKDEAARAKLEAAIVDINSAIGGGGSMTSLLRALQSEDSNLNEVDPQNIRWYQDILEKTKKDHGEGSEEELELTHDEIQDIILMANQIAEHTRLVEAAVLNINCVLQSEGDVSELVEALQNEFISLSAVSPSNIHYYYQGLRESLNRKRQESGNPSCLLTENEIQEVIHQSNNQADHDNKVTHAFESINQAVVGEDHTATMVSLQSQYADIADIDDTISEKYHEALQKRRLEKGEDLTKEDITEVVAQVNEKMKLERLSSEGLQAINVGINTVEDDVLLQLLNNQYVGLERVVPNNAPHYATLLSATGKKNLSKAEIQSVIDRANSQAQEALELAQNVQSINQSLATGDANTTLSALKAAGLRSITDDCATAYHDKLHQAADEVDGEPQEWVEHRSRDGHTYYYNKTTGEISWVQPDSPLSSKDLTRDMIQTVVTKVTADYDRWALLQSNEPTIILLQSWWKGALVRKAYSERLSFFRAHEKEIVLIQSQWKGLAQRRAYKSRLELLHSNVHLVVKIQSLVRMYRKRKQYRERLKYFQDNIAAIIKIQTFWRAKKTKKDYKQLVEVTQPPASAVRKFLSLLEQSGLDFSEEIECQRLKSQVVQQIRSNQQLEQDLNVMDIKIGLLVRNRISLQDVVTQSDQIKRNRRRKHHHTTDDDDDVTALGGMSKTNQEKIEAYQHLFYLLQTNPHYFANLIFEMSPNRTNQFMENVILSVLNYAQNNREQYLLVRLFEAALLQEVDSKVFAIKDIITGNPTVIKMVIHYTRSDTGGGQNVLRDLLHPLVQDIIGQEDLVLNISPVDVYKAWINQMESETGEKSKLPYEVSNDDALQHDEVKTRIAQTIQVLIDATEKFQHTIMTSVNRIPYAMRYIAMRLRQALLDKFPDTAADDVLKVVGNLLYYRYMNPAIVAPDAFDIIDMGVDKRALETEQRRNLGAIAKVLQHAAAGKLFEGENAALSSMNGYIQKAFEKFKEFFLAASTVESPAEKFGYDEYTDVIMLTKPVIYITVKELLRTHTLLVEHEEALAPEQTDPLRELLKDLGSIPTAEQLLGGVREPLPNEKKEDVIDEASKQELALTLNNKFEVVTDDGSDMKALFVRTKRMVVDLLKVQPGDNITQVLYTPATVEQEEEHQKLIQQRQKADKDKLNISATLHVADSTFTERDLPLEGMKRKIMRQLRTLEQEDIVSSKDDYQEIINAIARDIRNQHRHRQQRKQELHRLQETLEKLNQKSRFFEEQVEYYQQYVKACLESLAKAGGKGGPAGPEFKRQSIKYTAHRLHEKGVVLEIEGLPKHQFKNATIEITATEAGMFEVTGRVMGMTFEKVELVFQDLLQLQYEGVAVMKMFGRAKINVNLLIYLINKKFYGKG